MTLPAGTASVEEAAAELRDIRKAVLKLRAWLRKNRPERGPAGDQREAIDIILKHLDVHGRSLWGHVIRLPPTAQGSAKFRLVDRTNNVDESWFHGLKHAERRRSGRKILTQDLEQLPAAAALARNLLRPDYVELVCGSLERLPAAFAELDRQQHEAAAKQRDAGKIALPVDNVVEIVSASLPKADRRLVRDPALEAKILAAVKSRSPTVDFRVG